MGDHTPDPLVEDVEFMLTHGENHHAILARLRMRDEALYAALRRRARLDVWRRLLATIEHEKPVGRERLQREFRADSGHRLVDA